MYDGKMIYSLTQHSTWSRKFKPFLLCDCLNGTCISLDSHVCVLISNIEQQEEYSQSLRRYERHRLFNQVSTKNLNTRNVVTKVIVIVHIMVSIQIYCQG